MMKNALLVFLVLALTVPTSYCQDSYEPNSEIGDATDVEFGQMVSADISPARDVDFYKIYADSSGILELELEAVPEDMRARIDIYGKNGNWITRKDATNPGDLLTFERDVAGPGVYYVAILDLEGMAHSGAYSIKFGFEPTPDTNEPNDVIGDSTWIWSGQIINGYISPSGDVDFYEFYADHSGILRLEFLEVPEDMRTRVDIYDKNGNWITRKDASNSGDSMIFEKDIAGPGDYYMAVLDLEGKAHSAGYSFEFEFEEALDLNESNDVIGDATHIEFDQILENYISPAGDVDFYKFCVDHSGILRADLFEVPEDMRARIDIYGKNFNWITRKDATNPGDSLTFEKGLSGPGCYYAAVSDLQKEAHSAGYSIEFAFDEAPDTNEPNDVIGDAADTELGESVEGYICPGGDVDFYKIYVSSPGILQMGLEEVPEDMRARIDLYGKNFNWIARKDASNPGDSVTFERGVQGPEVYYVAISDLNGGAHVVEYSLDLALQISA